MGAYLKKQYRRALRVDLAGEEAGRRESLASNRIERGAPHRGSAAGAGAVLGQRVKRRALVFLQSSPDYCQPNATEGYQVGTCLK